MCELRKQYSIQIQITQTLVSDGQRCLELIRRPAQTGATSPHRCSGQHRTVDDLNKKKLVHDRSKVIVQISDRLVPCSTHQNRQRWSRKNTGYARDPRIRPGVAAAHQNPSPMQKRNLSLWHVGLRS
nr:hypothetical protein CFP56_79430 [Quercus suber]